MVLLACIRERSMTMMAAALATLAAVASSYKVSFEDVVVGNYTCHLDNYSNYQGARVYYPDAPGRFPVIAWAHGFNNPGNQSYLCYAGTLESIAAGGYVVIAAESSSWPQICLTEWRDQFRSLEWARSSKLAVRINVSQAGLMGHSMGGGATVHAAAQADAVKEHHVGAAVILHAAGGIPKNNGSQPVVPIFYGGGSQDIYANWTGVRAAYHNVTGVSKALEVIEGAIHQEPQTECLDWQGHNKSFGRQRHSPFIVAFFDCHLKGNISQCGKIYSDEMGSMCNGDVKMTVCEHTSEPTGPIVAV